MAAIAGRGVCLLEPVFDEDQVLADMARHGATHLVGGDDLVARLADAWGRRRRELPAWRWLGIADFAGRAEELAAWAETEFGAVATGVYGSSEVFALAAMWPPEEPAPHRWRAGGRLVSPGMEARVVDPVSRQVLGPSARGELELAGPSVVDAYLGDHEALAAAVSAEGWFATGDLAEVDQEGAITFYCRMGDVLRLRGFLVDPAEIEHRLAAHEAVRSTKVVGIRGPDGGEAAVAFVVPRPGASPDPDELRAWCADTLAGFKVPAAVHLIEDMPTTVGTNGTKIRAGVLREWAQDLATP
jgi:fatty-acyl-CoA synthase